MFAKLALAAHAVKHAVEPAAEQAFECVVAMCELDHVAQYRGKILIGQGFEPAEI